MTKLADVKEVKSGLLRIVMATALATLVAIPATRVRASDLSEYLAACGRGHAGGSAVWFHCFPVPE